MKELKYIIEDKTIAELLGEQNFNNKESAILELVKNAYDANAKTVYLTFKEDSIIIKDDGHGMNEVDIMNSWMHVGKSYKDYEIDDIMKGKRVLAGAKGIGRFALAKLGKNVELYTCKNGISIKWETDWNKSFLTQSDYMCNDGTEIIISCLRELWDDVAIEGLCKFLSKTYNDDKMKIYIKYEEIKFEVKKYFSDIVPGKNCLSKINLEFDGEKAFVRIVNDEFLDRAQNKVDVYNITHKEPKLLNIYSYENGIDVFEEIKTDVQTDKSIKKLSDQKLKNLINEIGSFKAELFFVMAGKISSEDANKFLYKYTDLSDKLETGVVLYRNAFSISSFEGEKDWLDLNKRVRKSPAAASHETGAWRVRDSQLGGKVEIDKKLNYKITDLSNRQGVEENIYYKIFKQIISLALKEFERYRQKIIRAIYKEIREQRKENKAVEKFLRKPEEIISYSKDEIKALTNEVKELNKETKILSKRKYEVELRYKYDIRILNSLSTVGLKAAAIAHEMKNDKGNLSKNVDLIVSKLKSLDMWDELMSEENTRYSDNNVPKMLEDTRRVNQKILSFMNTMLTQIEKNQFDFSDLNIKQIIEKLKSEWEKDYSWVKIHLECAYSNFYLSEDLLKTIFDNLILNSVQQNEKSNNLNIFIGIIEESDNLIISYRDDGVGLIEKYRNDPRRILEVHESSRKKGHGLGMWIVNNSINMCNGTIKNINGDNGFSFEFTLGDLKKKDGEV